MIRVAIVEDNPDLLDELAFNLRHAGFAVTPLADGAALGAHLERENLDVLVLDLCLPGEDGISIAERLRSSHPRLGIVMLSARTTMAERIKGMNTGADIYLGKPVEMDELVAAIRSVARRTAMIQSEEPTNAWLLETNALCIHAPDGNTIELTLIETQLLKALIANESAASRKMLVEAIGYNYLDYDERRLESLISRLRRKLAPHDGGESPLRSARGKGYLFIGRLRLK